MNNGIKRIFSTAVLAVTLIVPLQANAWWGYDPRYSNWGPFDGVGDMFGDMDFNFSFGGNTRSRFNGYGFSRPYYGYPYYAPAYVAYAPPVAQPAVPARVVPADGDADGVVDASDLCPDSDAGAQVDAFGCQIDAAIVLRGVNFRHDSDQLTEQSLSILDGVAATLTANPDLRVQVAGHTDSQGEDVYNKELSQRRATAVVNYLVAKGVASANLVPIGYGEEQPVADNASAAGRAENRRVELVRFDG